MGHRFSFIQELFNSSPIFYLLSNKNKALISEFEVEDLTFCLSTCVLKLRQLLVPTLSLFSDYLLSSPGKQSHNKGSCNIYISSGLTVSLKSLSSIQLYWPLSLDKYFWIFISSTFGQYISVQFELYHFITTHFSIHL